MDGWPLEASRASVIWAIRATWVWSRPSDQHGCDLGHHINMGVIWAIRSRWREWRFITEKFLIFWWFFIVLADLLKKLTIYCLLSINRPFLLIFLPSDKSLQNIMSPASDTQYISDISSIYPDIFFHILNFHLSRCICI